MSESILIEETEMMKEKEVRKVREFRLTARDLDILEFCLEMKFSSLDSIARKFFSVESDEQKTDAKYPKQRLWRLCQNGFLRSQRISFNGRAFYQATPLAFKKLILHRPQKCLVSPSSSIDIRTFEHDNAVIEARLVLEAKGRVVKWMSERALKSQHSTFKGLARDYQPDAIFINHMGDEVAFELEMSLKSEARYKSKISKFESLIHESTIRERGVTKVLFVCASDESYQALSSIVNPSTNHMMVMRFADLKYLQPLLQNSKTNRDLK